MGDRIVSVGTARIQTVRSLIHEIESVLAVGSADRRIETLRRVADLFLLDANRYSDEQVGLFDDVIGRLADQIETQARAELAHRLAPVANAPVGVIRALASDASIEVAGPVLTQSQRLSVHDLMSTATDGSQQHLLAISKRSALGEEVTDVLVTRGDQRVVRSVAQNGGARFSNSGFGILVEKSGNDEELAHSVGSRSDLPRHHFHALVAKASDAVLNKLAAANPQAYREIQGVVGEITGKMKVPEPTVARDYANAKEIVELIERAGGCMDSAVLDFAGAGKFEEVVVCLSALTRLPIDAIERILSNKSIDSDPLLIVAKAAGLSWKTAKQIVMLRLTESGISPQALETARQRFETLQAGTARRVIRFYHVRMSAADQDRATKPAVNSEKAVRET